MRRAIELLALLLCAACAQLAAQERLSHGRFADVALYRPQGEVRRVVLFLSGEKGWEGPLEDVARELAGRGAMVAGIDATRAAATAGDLENLSHFLQGYERLPTYHSPLLAGYASGAALASAAAAHAPQGTFLGVLELAAPPGAESRSRFLDEYDALPAEAVLPPPPASLSDLPIVEVRNANAGSTFAVMLSGDGGWAGLDKNVAAALAREGIEVVGVDSLRYFWKGRTPRELADDVDRIVRYYAAHWRKHAVVLIGYSQGADVLPFAINRLPAASGRLLIYSVLLGPGKNAMFEFHVGNWLGRDGGVPVRPEAEKLRAGRTLCMFGKEEKESLCPLLPQDGIEVRAMPGSHHFDGAYDAVAAVILEHIKAQASP